MQRPKRSTANSAVSSLGATVAADREWFERHPSATVRLRKETTSDFSDLINQGHEVPTFIPRSFDQHTRLTGVAVINLTRLIEANTRNDSGAIRIRLRTVAVRSKKHRQLLTEELQRAVAEDLISLITQTSNPGIDTQEEKQQLQRLAS